ncbi:hypothetical protein [Tepidiforma sp.]|uniref:hypothetical protein n=1 Tax=Tepidiforma sp. TaxID=2682230 RepID=UPI002ADD954F|nr:hypothetical protein [Tepidiforma sp.]
MSALVGLAFLIVAAIGFSLAALGWRTIKTQAGVSPLNRTPGPWLVFAGVALAASGLAVAPFAFAAALPGAFAAVLLFILAAMTVAVAVSGAIAIRRSSRRPNGIGGTR